MSNKLQKRITALPTKRLGEPLMCMKQFPNQISRHDLFVKLIVATCQFCHDAI